MTRPLPWLPAALVLVLAGCALNPVTGRPQLTILSKGAERYISDHEVESIVAEIGVVEMEPLRSYVAEVGARVAAHSPRQDVTYEFRVLDQPEPNAFALPAGPVFVTRGLLALLTEEDELAGVLGHEIGHVAARHTARRATIEAPFALVLGVPAALAGLVNDTLGRLVSVPKHIADALVVAPYSRAQEQQADDIGMELAAAAGYDPAALGRALALLEREQALETGVANPRAHYLDSHPTTKARVDRIHRHEGELRVADPDPLRGDPRAFVAVLDGLCLGADPQDGVFEGADFLHPLLSFRATFPEGWHTSNTDDAVIAWQGEPDGERAFAVLQMAARSDEPLDGLRADRVRQSVIDASEVVRIHGLPAVRARTERGGHFYDVTWVAYQGLVYRVAGVAPVAARERMEPVLDAFATSFAPLSEEDRARVRERRLRLIEPRRGEDLGQLLARVGSPWKPDRAAVANALETPASPLPTDRPVKYAREEPWTPPAEAPPESGGAASSSD